MASYKDRFAEQSMDVRRKAGVLRGVLIAVLSLLPLVLVSDLVTGDYVNAALEGVVLAFMGISLVILNTGRYREASLLTAIVTTLVLSAMSLVADNPHPALLFRNATYFIVAVSFSLLFVSDKRIALGISAAGAVFLAGFAFFVPTGSGLTLGDIVSNLISASILYFLVSFLLIKSNGLAHVLNLEIEEAQKLSQAQLHHMSLVVEGATDNLESMGKLTASVEEIRRLVADAGKSIETIEGRVRSMEETGAQSMDATSRIGGRIDELNQSIEAEFAAQVESSASVNEMVASIRNMADSASRRRESMEVLAGTADSGMKRLDILLSYISKIEGSVDSIQNMVKVINSIAGSTNLLSMNASIEAAHAGDAGRGFSVVAEEIRKLADTSGQNAKEISRQLKDVIPVITSAADESIHTKKGFVAIRDEIGKAIDAFREINSATEELAGGGKQILEAMKTLGEMSQQVKSGGAEIREAQGTVVSHLETSMKALRALHSEADLVRRKDEAILVAVQAVSSIGEEGVRNAEALQRMTRGDDGSGKTGA